jgi:hypothetical protein
MRTAGRIDQHALGAAAEERSGGSDAIGGVAPFGGDM